MIDYEKVKENINAIQIVHQNSYSSVLSGKITNCIEKLIKDEFELMCEGKMIIPWESEGLLISGDFIGDIFHKKFGDKSVDHIKIYIQKEE